MSGTEKRGGETKQKDKLLTSDCLVRGKFVAGKKWNIEIFYTFKNVHKESCMPPWKKVFTGGDVDKFNARLPMVLLERLLDIDLLGRTRMQRIKLQGDRQMVGSLFRC